MRWLNLRLHRHDDRGVVTVLIAIIFPVVFLGLAALATDVGGFYVQRAQTQNGADAGAIAVARSCASTTGCDLTGAATYAPANSNATRSLTSQVTSGFPCGRTPGGAPRALPACSSSPFLDTCPPAPASGNYVNVVDNTVKDDGSTTLVPTIFSQAVGGSGKTVAACAQARWGAPVIGGDVLALTFAECAWNSDVARKADGTRDYAPAPPAVPAASYEKELLLRNPDDASDPSCVSGPGVGPLPGGFGWTVPNLRSPCQATFTGDGWYSSDPGKGTQTGSQCTDKGSSAGVIPCAQNPVVSPIPYPPNGSPNACPTPATPSPLIIPIYDKVCTNTGPVGSDVDEVQTLSLQKVTGGTFTLSFTAPGTGQTAQVTGNIAYNATAPAVQTALSNLSNIGAGNIAVSLSSNGPTNTYTITFQGTLAHRDVPQIVLDATKLTGNGGSATMATTTGGQSVTSTNTCPAGFASGKSYYHLSSLTAFVVTGYAGPSFTRDQPSWLTNRRQCSVQGTGCMFGYFVQATIGAGDLGGDDTGVSIVKLSG